MQDQHKLIKGYRDLTQTEIDYMNQVKELASMVGGMVDNLMALEGIDKRWVSIGKTDLQTGFMALVRSIAQPQSF